MDPVDPDDIREVFPPVPESELPTLPDDWLAECVSREDPGSIEEVYRRDPVGAMNLVIGLERAPEPESRETGARFRARIAAVSHP